MSIFMNLSVLYDYVAVTAHNSYSSSSSSRSNSSKSSRSVAKGEWGVNGYYGKCRRVGPKLLLTHCIGHQLVLYRNTSSILVLLVDIWTEHNKIYT